ncbi:hypothetical protein DPPLL_24480 [Desulfofustis limnaeus]|jgi:hypothetical protein|uniref:Fe-S cluster assembly protein HesB n=1 Tax=Desulfofustis limnaeus TaxID=2740163 RepID=A0ABN6M5C6_9BACT|nr:hypothetical protein DPPLL_24480 [Desulfofustis limnaeus]
MLTGHLTFNKAATKQLKEDFMSLTVTDLAVSKLKEYLSQNNIESALRVALMQGG